MVPRTWALGHLGRGHLALQFTRGVSEWIVKGRELLLLLLAALLSSTALARPLLKIACVSSPFFR